MPAEKKQRVLIVDDSLEFRRSLVKIFLKAGFKVQAVADGQTALKVLRRRPFPLIVTDLKMAGTSGLDLLREIKAYSPEAQVIIVTAAGDIESYHEAMHLGVSAYLYKPLKRETILEAAQQALARHDHSGESPGGNP